jgi:hypothetical protein
MKPSGATAGGLMITVAKSFVEAEAVSVTQVRQGRYLQVKSTVVYLADFRWGEELRREDGVHDVEIVDALDRRDIRFIELDGSFYSGKEFV